MTSRISYKPLFHTLVEKDKAIGDLVRDLKFSPRTTSKFRKGESVSINTIARICDYLNCRVEDVVEIVKEVEE